MSIVDELQAASFRGATFFLTGSSIAGGRKDVKKEIVNSDAQVVEDLGLRQPAFSLSGIVAARKSSGQSYKQMRDALLDALQSNKGPGILVHPFYGSIVDVVCRSFTISESPASVGIARLTMNFEISNTLGTPEKLVAVLGTVATAAGLATNDLETVLAGEYTVTEAFLLNFFDAVEKVEEFVEVITAVADGIAQDAARIDQFSKLVSDIAANVTELIAAPSALAESIRGAVSSLNALLQTAPAVFEAMTGLFDFGDLDISFSVSTAGGKERKKNQDLLNSQVQGQALANAYTFAAQLDLPTVEAIDETQGILEDQFQKIASAGAIDRNSFDSLIATRVALSAFFDAQRSTKPRQVQIRTHTIPARVLAYSYYGSSDQGPLIAQLNNVRDGAFIEGEIEILSS